MRTVWLARSQFSETHPLLQELRSSIPTDKIKFSTFNFGPEAGKQGRGKECGMRKEAQFCSFRGFKLLFSSRLPGFRPKIKCRKVQLRNSYP